MANFEDLKGKTLGQEDAANDDQIADIEKELLEQIPFQDC